MMTTLTKAEEQVMQILWDEKEGFVKDLLQHFPEPGRNVQPPLGIEGMLRSGSEPAGYDV